VTLYSTDTSSLSNTVTCTLPHCHHPILLAFLSSQGSGLQSGVTHATGGYAGSFCTGVGMRGTHAEEQRERSAAQECSSLAHRRGGGGAALVRSRTHLLAAGSLGLRVPLLMSLWPPVRDLLLRAKHLFVAAIGGSSRLIQARRARQERDRRRQQAQLARWGPISSPWQSSCGLTWPERFKSASTPRKPRHPAVGLPSRRGGKSCPSRPRAAQPDRSAFLLTPGGPLPLFRLRKRVCSEKVCWLSWNTG
jgi:hypothetical protein